MARQLSSNTLALKFMQRGTAKVGPTSAPNGNENGQGSVAGPAASDHSSSTHSQRDGLLSIPQQSPQEAAEGDGQGSYPEASTSQVVIESPSYASFPVIGPKARKQSKGAGASKEIMAAGRRSFGRFSQETDPLTEGTSNINSNTIPGGKGKDKDRNKASSNQPNSSTEAQKIARLKQTPFERLSKPLGNVSPIQKDHNGFARPRGFEEVQHSQQVKRKNIQSSSTTTSRPHATPQEPDDDADFVDDMISGARAKRLKQSKAV